ncbi:MAG: hypothetical protein ABI949_12330 [Ilumatobacteraceae bacterium]
MDERATVDEAGNARGAPRGQRVRWSVTGAIAMVIFGVAGLSGSTSATVGSGERTVFVPITPCRLLDTRPGSDNVGQRQAPIRNNETFITTVRGVNGNCNLPGGAVGVSMNVTAVDPSASSFLVVYPSDGVRGPGSNLNWVAGQAPVPNAVTTKLSADGKVAIYNLSGNVDVIADINGYYEDHTFDDRYYTKAQVDAKIADEFVVSAGLGIPATLTPDLTVFPMFNETVTTSTSGRWLVTKSFTGRQACTVQFGSLYYLVVDGVPVRASAVFNNIGQGSVLSTTFVGSTVGVVPAGAHVIGIGVQCVSGATVALLTAYTQASVSSVTVLD